MVEPQPKKISADYADYADLKTKNFATESTEEKREKKKRVKSNCKSKGKSKKVNHELTPIDTNERVKKAEVGVVGV